MQSIKKLFIYTIIILGACTAHNVFALDNYTQEQYPYDDLIDEMIQNIPSPLMGSDCAIGFGGTRYISGGYATVSHYTLICDDFVQVPEISGQNLSTIGGTYVAENANNDFRLFRNGTYLYPQGYAYAYFFDPLINEWVVQTRYSSQLYVLYKPDNFWASADLDFYGDNDPDASGGIYGIYEYGDTIYETSIPQVEEDITAIGASYTSYGIQLTNADEYAKFQNYWFPSTVTLQATLYPNDTYTNNFILKIPAGTEQHAFFKITECDDGNVVCEVRTNINFTELTQTVAGVYEYNDIFVADETARNVKYEIMSYISGSYTLNQMSYMNFNYDVDTASTVMRGTDQNGEQLGKWGTFALSIFQSGMKWLVVPSDDWQAYWYDQITTTIDTKLPIMDEIVTAVNSGIAILNSGNSNRPQASMTLMGVTITLDPLFDIMETPYILNLSMIELIRIILSGTLCYYFLMHYHETIREKIL